MNWQHAVFDALNVVFVIGVLGASVFLVCLLGAVYEWLNERGHTWMGITGFCVILALIAFVIGGLS